MHEIIQKIQQNFYVPKFLQLLRTIHARTFGTMIRKTGTTSSNPLNIVPKLWQLLANTTIQFVLYLGSAKYATIDLILYFP